MTPEERRGVWIGVGAAVCMATILVGAQEPHTELERLQIENLALKQQIIGVTFRAETCEGQLAPYNLATDRRTLEKEATALKDRLEAARPGWEWTGSGYRKKDGR